MIKVMIIKDQSGSIRGFDVSGHSGYAEEGSDIICSAVSVTAYTAVGALEDLAGLNRCFSESDGHMVISLPDGMSAQQESTAAIILETTAIGFKQIGLSYGKYVLVLEEEV
jgi:uncharacterized protein YsxB (DUF464 family)